MYEDRLSLCLIGPGRLREVVNELPLKSRGVEVIYHPYPGGVHLLLSSKSQESLFVFKEKISSLFPTHLFTSTNGKIEEALHEALLKRNTFLILAESCTGGLIASKLTHLPDASRYLLGSLVVYSDELKRALLQVPQSVLETHGAVSKECVEALLKGLFQISSADLAIAVSGIAGPTGGTCEKPVGTVYIGIAKRGETCLIGKMQARGEGGQVLKRTDVIEEASNIALSLLYRYLTYGVIPWKE